MITSHSNLTYSSTLFTTMLAHPAPIAVTNVYAPSRNKLKQHFLDEIKSIRPNDNMPWLLIGGFNLLRFSTDKHKPYFRSNEAAMFNNKINGIALIEPPLALYLV